MPQFSDDIFLGNAQTSMGANSGVPLGDPSTMERGIGPTGRIYVWDVVPLPLNVANIAPAAVYTSAITIAAGTNTTNVDRSDGTRVVQLDCPRNIATRTGAGAPVNRVVTIVGYDIYGQKMSEEIETGAVQNTTVRGYKAFHQILSATISGSPVVTVSIGTIDVLGFPVRVSNVGYLANLAYANALVAYSTITPADSSTATTTTEDVRGQIVLPFAADGSRRLVAAILLTGLQAGPNATRLGALGVNQNLVT